MECVMICEVCKLPVFYDDEWNEFTCPHCNEEYESIDEEDIDMMIEIMEHFLCFLMCNRTI